MEQRNLILAIVISVAIMFGWQFLFEKPKLEKQAAQQTAQQQTAPKPAPPSTTALAPAVVNIVLLVTLMVFSPCPP